MAGKIATIGSVGSGALFSVAWSLFIGALLVAHIDCIVWGGSWSERHLKNCTEHNHTVTHHEVAPDAFVSGAYWAPGILSSFGLIGLNLISWEAVVEEGSFGDGVVVCARVFTLGSLMLLFGGLGTALWCVITDFQNQHAWHLAGIMTILQNVLIFLAAFIFRLSRRSGDHAI